jgi:hypothetical protein
MREGVLLVDPDDDVLGTGAALNQSSTISSQL